MSHACVVAANRKVYRALDADVEIVTPHLWRHEYDPEPFPPQPPADVTPMRVLRPGSIQLHAYVGPLARRLRGADVLYVEEEPYSVPAAQWAYAAFRAKVPFAFYTLQNIVKRYPWDRWVFGRAAGAVALSREVEETLRARGYRGRVDRVPLAIDTDFFAASPRPGRKVVGFAGRLVPEKGLDVLVAAMRELPDARLLVVGSGPLAGRLREAGAEVRENVGHADMPAAFAEMDVLAVPSLTTGNWKEQFGRVALEALSCGVPIATSDSGELPVLVAETGGGIATPEGDPALLARAIRELLADPARGARGREVVVERYSVPAVARRLMEALHAARSAHPRPAPS